MAGFLAGMPQVNAAGTTVLPLPVICPCCGSGTTEPFFEIRNAPIFSLVTVKSFNEAIAVPRRDIQLSFCHGCGFIFNGRFDPGIDYFSLGYEDQQGFSRTFMQFLDRIAREQVDRHKLRGKRLLEIGCGKGDFIVMLAELAEGIGFGIDPAYQPGRQTSQRVTFFRETFSTRHGELAADFICCRHTLEHIHQPLAFLRVVRESIDDRFATALFFEVPDVDRILELPAFWDIYYEHCNYFSIGSLARLFRRAGFDVAGARLDYGDQYILLEAAPSAGAPLAALANEEAPAAQYERVKAFTARVRPQLAEWRERLTDVKRRGKTVVVWGGGSKSVGFLTNFADLALIEFVVDINPHMENNYIPGIGCRYVRPNFLAGYRPDVVIVMNSLYKAEIVKTLGDMGLHPEIHAL